VIVELTAHSAGNSTMAVGWAAIGATAAIAPRALRALPTTPNYRGAETPFPAGVIAAPFITITAPHPLLNAGVAVLGLLDDLAGGEAPRGLRGHARAGRLTTGHLKAIGTIGLAAATTRDPRRAAVITLATHVFNVLDLRPGRATKAFAATMIATRNANAIAAAGPLLVIAAYDLRERAMLGDTGSTLLGAIAAQHLPNTPRTIATLAAIALVAELTSLTALIDRVPPLRALDWLGRRNSDA
jgi:UDP-GlcNAc:undecaprenyl-phosphate/decaprenyl-phosphate GlcNAc-1-phosphate transferase